MSIITIAFRCSNQPELHLKSKGINQEKKAPLGKIRNLQLSKGPRSTLTLMRKGITSLSSTKWSSRLRCAETGNFSESASSRTLAVLHMESMNFTKKRTCLLTIRLNYVISSTQLPTALMVIGASFCIRSMTSLTLSPWITLLCYLRMRGYPTKEPFPLRKA